MQLRFWGVRGSLPTSRVDTRRYGGNTPCVEVRAGQQIFILDAGSGVRDLGEEALARSSHFAATLLLSHYHWDHVQGLPFYTPIYLPDSTLAIFGPRPEGGLSLEGILLALFRSPFFPVSATELQSNLRLEEVDGKAEFGVGDMNIRTCRSNHPQGGLCYRLEQEGVSLVYASDHEPGDPVCDRAVRQLAEGADVLISDAQYEPGQLSQKQGWGHGSWESSVALARDARVKSLIFFHHDPSRSDLEIDEIVSQARRIFPCLWAATEGMCIDINREKLRVRHERLTEEHSFTESRTPMATPGSELTINLWSGSTPPSENGSLGNEGCESEDPQEWLPDREVLPDRPQAVEELAQSAERRSPLIGVGVLESNSVSSESEDTGSLLPRESSPKRRYPRISLEGTKAYVKLKDGSGSKAMPAVDLSFGGLSFLTDDAPHLAETFEVHLNVPVLPVANYRVRQVYVQPAGSGRWRVGCSFSP